MMLSSPTAINQANNDIDDFMDVFYYLGIDCFHDYSSSKQEHYLDVGDYRLIFNELGEFNYLI